MNAYAATIAAPQAPADASVDPTEARNEWVLPHFR
jgi:hypothetical protein